MADEKPQPSADQKPQPSEAAQAAKAQAEANTKKLLEDRQKVRDQRLADRKAEVDAKVAAIEKANETSGDGDKK